MNTRNILLAAVAVSACLLPACDNCDDLRSESKALVQEYASCSEGDTCKLVDMYELLGPNNCMGAFQCSKAVNSRANLGDLQERAVVIIEDYETCGMCEQAGCPDPNSLQARCNASTGRCEAVSIVQAIGDAGVPVGDSGVAD